MWISIILLICLTTKNEAFQQFVSNKKEVPFYSTMNGSNEKTSIKKYPMNCKSMEREIVSLGRKGKTDEALFLYYELYDTSVQHEIKKKEIHSTTRLMNAAIDACARAHPPRMEEAFDIFDYAVNVDKRLSPNVFTFGALMSACARARDADRAVQLLEEMETKYNILPNRVVYSTAISAAERSKPTRSHLALSLLREMMSSSIIHKRMNPSNKELTIAYNTAISALARDGQFETAIQLLEEEMPREGVLPDEVTYGTVMAACERSKKWKLILKFANQMEINSYFMDGITITTVLKACQQLGWANGALKYISKFKELPTMNNRKTQGKQRMGIRAQLNRPDDVAYCLAISACSRAGRINDALSLLHEIPTEKRSVNAYTAVIQGYGADYESALKLLNQMKSDIPPNVVTYSTIISICAAAIAKSMDDLNLHDETPFQTALQLFSEMKEQNIHPNIITYNAIIKACAEAKEIDKAFMFLNELQTKHFSPTIVTFGTLMTACERVGDVAAAGKVFSKMEEENIEPNEIVYGAAISCCRKGNQPERALLLLRKMIHSSRLHPNIAVYNTVLMALTNSESDPKNILRAAQLFTIMKTSTEPNRQTFSILLRAMTTQIKPPMAEESEQLLHNMKLVGFLPDVDQYTAVVNAYERNSKPLRALRLMETMREEGFDFYENQVLNETFKKLVKIVNAMTGSQTKNKK